MGHPCYGLLPSMKQPIRHLVSVTPVRPLFQSSHYSVLPLGQSHLRRNRDVLAGPNFCSIQSSLDAKHRVEKFFEVEMIVRDCELDKYGVVASAVYADYVNKGREVVAGKLGINTDLIAEKGVVFATSELNLKYFAPMRGGSRFVVKSWPVKIKGVRVFIEHLIETLPDHKVVLKATSTIVCLNEDYHPTRLIPEISNNLQHLLSDDANLSLALHC